MLINKSKNNVEVKFNGKIITVVPGGELDVRDFGVQEINPAEQHICKKNLGVFSIESSAKQQEIKKQTFDRIKDLEAENKVLSANLDTSIDNEKKMQVALDNMKSEVSGYKEKIQSLREDIAELRAKLKAAQ